MPPKLRRKELEALGFERITEWVLRDHAVKLADHDWPYHSFVLYAFMTGRQGHQCIARG